MLDKCFMKVEQWLELFNKTIFLHFLKSFLLSILELSFCTGIVRNTLDTIISIYERVAQEFAKGEMSAP